jgi:hypothetical protein
MMKLDLSATRSPPIGLVLLIDDQRYELVTTEPYQRADGEWTSVLIWRSACVDCGAPFTFTTSKAVPRWLNRRCELHKKPGNKVKHASRASAEAAVP